MGQASDFSVIDYIGLHNAGVYSHKLLYRGYIFLFTLDYIILNDTTNVVSGTLFSLICSIVCSYQIYCFSQHASTSYGNSELFRVHV